MSKSIRCIDFSMRHDYGPATDIEGSNAKKASTTKDTKGHKGRPSRA